MHRFEQGYQHIEDTKHHKLHHIPTEQCGILQVLCGASFVDTAFYDVVLGLSLPLQLAISAGCVLAVLLKLYEYRVFLPRFSRMRRLPKQTDISRRQRHKPLIISGFLIVLPLLILWNQTYQNPVVVTLMLTVIGTSAFQFIRQP